MSADRAIEVSGLHVVRGGRPVLRDVSVRVRAGTVTGLLGPSGCGKTTLMRAIVGVQIVEGGRVSVLGSPAGSRDLRPRVGYVTQAPSVYGDLSVEENLRYFARIVGVGARRVEDVLDTVELASGAPAGRRFALGRPALARLARDGPAEPARAARPRRAHGGSRPGPARRAVGHVPRARRLGDHAADLQPRDGRGPRVRRAAAHARGGDPRPHDATGAAREDRGGRPRAGVPDDDPRGPGDRAGHGRDGPAGPVADPAGPPDGRPAAARARRPARAAALRLRRPPAAPSSRSARRCAASSRSS